MAIEVKLPDVGEGVTSGTVVGVLVKQGDKIHKDQPLVELETDKAVLEVPSTASGVVKQVNVTDGDEVPIGAVLVVVDEAADSADAADSVDSAAGSEGQEEEPAAEPAEEAADDSASEEPAATGQISAAKGSDSPASGATEAAPRGPVSADSAPRQSSPSAQSQDGARLVPAAPSVRRLARELGVDIRGVHGSGLMGRVSAQDVRTAATRPSAGAPAQQAQPLPDFSRWGEVEREPMSGIRKATLRAMTNAWSTVPMVTHFDQADVTALERFRKRHQKEADKVGAKLTPTAVLLKVVAIALTRFPDFNASIDESKMEVVRKRYVNVGVAVDTDAGLLVPVVKNADRKGIFDLAKELGDLAEKARARKLGLEEMQGGNFSISNLGGIGGTGFTPIVNPPDVAILGVSRAGVVPVWNDEEGVFEPRTVMPLALTYDHRLIDGAAAARFLRWVCAALEDPFVALLDA